MKSCFIECYTKVSELEPEIMKIISLVGARPQFVKVRPINLAISEFKSIQHLIVNSGQHYQSNMSFDFFEELRIPPPDFNLCIGSGSHGAQTSRAIERFEKVLDEVKPEGVIIYGDTNTTLAGSIVTSKKNIPLFHVEAGLRSKDRRMPEEVNRVVADHLSNLNFVPTSRAFLNLIEEGLKKTVIEVGDVMLDNFLQFKSEGLFDSIKNEVYGLVTLHRPSNVDDPKRLKYIISKLSMVPFKLYWPVHPRLNYEEIRELIEFTKSSNITLLQPISYLNTMRFLINARICITDSGGLQKESFFGKIPTITVRDTTEWPETLTNGNNHLDVQLNSSFFNELVRTGSTLAGEGNNRIDLTLFGDGKASKKIVKSIYEFISNSTN